MDPFLLLSSELHEYKLGNPPRRFARHFSSGLLCPPCGFMSRPSLVWGGPKNIYPLMLGEAEKGRKQAMD